MKFIYLLLLVPFIFINCSSLPKDPDGDAVFVIPIQHDSAGYNKYFVYYRLYYDTWDNLIKFHSDNASLTENELIVYPEKQFSITEDLTPGDYRVFSIQSNYFKSYKILDRYNADIRFTLKPNTVTISRKAIRVSWYQKNQKNYQKYDIVTLMEKDIKSIIQELKEYRNSSNWSFFY